MQLFHFFHFNAFFRTLLGAEAATYTLVSDYRMLLFGSAAVYRFEFADFETNCAANACFFVYYCFAPFKVWLLFNDNGFLRAFCDAGSAFNALIVVNMGKVIGNFNCVVYANLFAESAADTANFADLACFGTAVM